jgi:hypothetical protein
MAEGKHRRRMRAMQVKVHRARYPNNWVGAIWL